jgi:hypothetical protein
MQVITRESGGTLGTPGRDALGVNLRGQKSIL